MKNNIVGWFEIPVLNMKRAISFYEEVFDISLERNQMGPLDMAWFPYIDGAYGSGGSLVYHKEFYKPSNDGIVVYLTALSGDLEYELSKVEDAGGTILQHKTKISDDHGFMAVIHDSEGNRIALHSRA